MPTPALASADTPYLRMVTAAPTAYDADLTKRYARLLDETWPHSVTVSRTHAGWSVTCSTCPAHSAPHDRLSAALDQLLDRA